MKRLYVAASGIAKHIKNIVFKMALAAKPEYNENPLSSTNQIAMDRARAYQPSLSPRRNALFKRDCSSATRSTFQIRPHCVVSNVQRSR